MSDDQIREAWLVYPFHAGGDLKMFTIYTDSRSAWTKSIDKAIDLVIAGKMSRAEFSEISVPSPDSRDPLPEIKLENAIKTREFAAERRAAFLLKEQAKTKRHNELAEQKIWRLCGVFVEDMDYEETYTLGQLQRWADCYGYVFSGSGRGFEATCGELTFSLSHDIPEGRKFRFAAAVKSLREFAW